MPARNVIRKLEAARSALTEAIDGLEAQESGRSTPEIVFPVRGRVRPAEDPQRDPPGTIPPVRSRTRPLDEPRRRPDPPPQDRPVIDGHTLVSVSLARSGVDWNTSMYVSEGQTTLQRTGDLGLLACRSHGVTTVALCNPFPGAGAQTYESLAVRVGGVQIAYASGQHMLLPGRIKSWSDADGLAANWGEPGPDAQDAALPKLEQWAADASGFSMLDDCEVFGNRDANEPSGMLIYPNIGYWADHPLGRRMAHRLLRAYAARMPIFRYDRRDWDAGKLVTVDSEDPFPGYGGCGVDQFSEYKAELVQDPHGELKWNSLDHAHLGRIGHSCSRLAAWGDGFAQIVQDALTDDVAFTWIARTGHGGSKGNLLHWSADDFLNRWPARRGCVQLGRPFGHALILMAEWTERAGMSGAELEELLNLAAHVQSPGGQVYLIEPTSPASGVPLGEYAKKLTAKGMVTPPGSPPLQATFEEQIVLYGVERGVEVMERIDNQAVRRIAPRHPQLALWRSVTARMAHALGAFPPEIKFPDAPKHDSKKTTIWGHGLSPIVELGGYDLEAEAAKWPPFAGPCAAFDPSLWGQP